MTKLMRAFAAGLIALALCQPAFAQTVRAPEYLNSGGIKVPSTGIVCIDVTTKNPTTCSSGGGGGGASATANAADQTYTEAATGQVLSIDLAGYLRSRVKAVAGSYQAGAFAAGAGVDGWDLTQGAKADGYCTAYTLTTCTIMARIAALEKAAEDYTTAVPTKGSIASGTAATDPPLYAGCRASLAAVTAVADTQMVGMRCTKNGALVVHQFSAPELSFRFTPVTLTSTTETTIIAAPGSGLSNAIVQLHACNNSATQVRIDFRDDTGGTVQDSWTLAPGLCFGYVLNTPMKQTATNKNWTAQLSANVTDVRVSGQYVQ